MIRPDRLSPILFAVAALGAGCTGQVSDNNGNPGMPGPGPNTPGNPDPGRQPDPPPSNTPITPDNSAGPTPLRRLTIFEYNNTIRDLLGTTAPALEAGAVAVDQPSTVGFANGASITTSVDARNFLDVTEKLSAGSALANLLPQGCATPAAGAEQDCAKQFIKQFGLRAYRRPLTADEETDLFTLYSKVRAPDVGATFAEGIKALISGMIQSAYFLYRWELGGDPLKDGALVRLNSYEIASRLSYFLTATMPDQQLFDAAAKNDLVYEDKIADQAKRLLASPKAKDGLRDFVLQWLNLTGLPGMQKDPTFTNFTPAVAKSMLDETAQFMAQLVQGPQAAKLETLFTSQATYVNAPLAKVYGASGVTGDELRQVTLSGSERGGILTQGAFLAAHSDADLPHPIRRAKDVTNRVLCMNFEPPANVDIPPVGDRTPGQTNRARFEQATAGPAGSICAGCHSALNPIGFAFESYNAVGEYQTTDVGKPIDASGTITLGGTTVNFRNAVELSKVISTAQETRDCMTKQFIRYVLHREDVPQEKGSIVALTEAFQKSGYDLKELLVATTKTRAFTHRQPLAGEGQK
jgi:hypothetical protein